MLALTERARPLLITTDTSLLDELVRLAGLAGVEVDVAPDRGAASAIGGVPPLVLLGVDAARAAGGGPHEGRESHAPPVVLVTDDADDAAVWRLALEAGAAHVAVLPDAEPWLVDRLREAVDPHDPAPVVGVIGGRGGAGASTLAAALAVTAARRGKRALLLDGDPLGGGIDLLLGGENAAGVRWPDLATPGMGGRLDGVALREALPVMGDLAVLSFDRTAAPSLQPHTVREVIRAARSAGELVVIDLARHLSEAGQVAAAACDAVLLVVPAEVRACASAARVAASIRTSAGVSGEVAVVVRGPAPSGLRGSDIAEAVGLPLAGFLRPEPRLAAALERGDPPARDGTGPLATFCAGHLDRLLAGAPAASLDQRSRSA